jgi:hypothetical protein
LIRKIDNYYLNGGHPPAELVDVSLARFLKISLSQLYAMPNQQYATCLSVWLAHRKRVWNRFQAEMSKVSPFHSAAFALQMLLLWETGE